MGDFCWWNTDVCSIPNHQSQNQDDYQSAALILDALWIFTNNDRVKLCCQKGMYLIKYWPLLPLFGLNERRMAFCLSQLFCRDIYIRFTPLS